MHNSIQQKNLDDRSTPSPLRGSLRYIKSLSFTGQKRILNDETDKDQIHSSLPQDLGLSPRSFTPTTSKSGRSKSHSLKNSSKVDRTSSPFSSATGRFSRKRSKTPQARLVSDPNNSVLQSSINTPQEPSNLNLNNSLNINTTKDLLLTPLSPISLSSSARRPGERQNGSSYINPRDHRSQNHLRERLSPRKPSMSVIERPSDLSFLEALEELDEELEALEGRRMSVVDRTSLSTPREREVAIPHPPPQPEVLTLKLLKLHERSLFLKHHLIHTLPPYHPTSPLW
eukprot:TRINITY_DN1106_c0_g1_i2.p1 TRINITY_DN1106_c0_g1~~TRINITY_DN1106_c0_g1_i2.p1  ORF type:complete len:285 (+),score=76.69 TRINITY_DN1106_c0_g1_i2:112-966(+)